MRSLQKMLFILVMSVAASLLSYEIACKSTAWPGGPLPGWHEAQIIERWTPYVRWTGSSPVDRLIHEGQEAVAYYSFLLRREPRPSPRVSRSPRINR